jgi:hypothetical protein
VRLRRVYAAGVALGVALAAAVWLLTYRTWTLFEYIDRTHHHFRPSERVRVAPWWSVPATVAVLLAGVATSLALLPGSRGMVRRLANHFSKVAERNRERRPDGAAPQRRNHTIDAAGT